MADPTVLLLPLTHVHWLEGSGGGWELAPPPEPLPLPPLLEPLPALLPPQPVLQLSRTLVKSKRIVDRK